MTSYMIELTPVVAIAFEVLAGKWGNDAERKKKLEAEGYDYNKVQKCVNDLVALMERYK